MNQERKIIFIVPTGKMSVKKAKESLSKLVGKYKEKINFDNILLPTKGTNRL